MKLKNKNTQARADTHTHKDRFEDESFVQSHKCNNKGENRMRRKYLRLY